MSCAARASPLFHGRTSATATRKPEASSTLDHAGEIASGLFDRSPLHDVVDAALHDQKLGAFDGFVEARCNLVGALAVHAVIAEVELRRSARRPPLPLAALVGLADARAHNGIRIPERRAGRDRITEAGDDHGSLSGDCL